MGNSHTEFGKFNSACATLGTVAATIIYFKMSGGSKKVDAEGAGAPPFPLIKSTHSLVAKHVTPEKWSKLGGLATKTSGFTLSQAIACAVEFDDQHCGIYAGDEDSYKVFADVFDPLIMEYHGLPEGFKHTSDMDHTKIRVGRSIEGFGLSPGITSDQRLGVEKLMGSA